MITVHQVTQGTDEWQELRRDRYTGSNAGKLLKFGAIKYALTETGSFGGNYYTKRGHILEDEAIELYEVITGGQVLRPGFVTNSKFPLCGYSPDGIDGQTLLEVKCFNEERHAVIAKGEIPFSILAQIHFGLLITGLREARLILYNPDLDPTLALKILPVKANRNIENNFKRILKQELVNV